MTKLEEKILKAPLFAKRKHKGQKDDCGCDYFRHPKQVASIIMAVCPEDLNLVQAAWLHDTLEDTDTTYEELVQEFGQDVADLVNEVTHDGQKDTHGYYFPRLKTKRGIILKFADRMANLSHMDVWPEERQQHYLSRSKFWKDLPPTP